MGYGDDNDQVDDEARKEAERVRNDLLRIVLGDRDLSGNGRMNRGRAVFVKDEILEKKKKKDESEQREAFKRAQEVLDRQLEDLQRQIEAIKRQIAEAKKDILDVEEQLRKKYGDNWEEKFRRGEADKNDRLYKEWAQKHERLDELEKKREELEESLDKLKEKANLIRTRNLTPDEEASQLDQLARDAKAVTLRFTRTQEDTKGPNASGLTLNESGNPLQDELFKGAIEKIDLLAVDRNREAKSSTLESSGFFAASLDGDGSYIKGIGEQGLTSQKAFKMAAGQATAAPESTPDAETRLTNNKTFEVKQTLS